MNEQIKAIRAEIELLQEVHERNLKKPMERGRIGYAHGVVACCDRILSFIDSLPEETDNGVDVTDFCKPIEPGIAQCIADHWWEMLDDEESNRPMNSDSLEAAREAANEVYCYTTQTMDDLVGLFLAGAQWQKEQDEKEQADLFTIVALDAAQRAKEQMMKEAVEGLFWNTPFPTICLDDCKDYNFKDNQRVRIIIVKEDAQ